ncbi:MAG: DUF4159 domain-containing protein [Proteobacteria bacterium]|nr:DUF4159 domain-containing protein [Pseudomonadota bacterium]
MKNCNRRDMLGGLLGITFAPRLSWAFGDETKVDIAELELGPDTMSRPNAWKRLLYEVIQTTSVECVARSVRVDPTGEDLFKHPFSVLLGMDGFERVSDDGVEQLSRYLSYGGFLFIDDVSGSDSSGFDDSVRRLVRRVFPTRPLSPLPADHSVYRSFFLIENPVGRVEQFSFLEGVTVGNLCPLIYCRNDLSGALDRGDDGRHRHSCVPGGDRQRREAVKLGLNLIMYSLTANYKRDQAHVQELMREGRLR